MIEEIIISIILEMFTKWLGFPQDNKQIEDKIYLY